MVDRVQDWSQSANGNTSVAGISIAEGCAFASMNNMGREIMAAVRLELASGESLSASGTVTVTGAGEFKEILGNSTITGFSTAVTGVYREARVRGTPLIKYNASSLITPDAVDYQAAADDMLRLRSLGAGNWIMSVNRRTALVNTSDLVDGAVTFAKMQAIVDGTLLGASGGVTVEGITVGTGLSLAANTLSVTATTPTTPYNYIGGCALSNNAVTPNTKIDVAAGAASDSANADTISYAGGTLDLATTGANGLRTGSLANTTNYAVFLIKGTSGVALFADTALTPGARPSGYQASWRRIGVFITDGSAHVRAFVQSGRTVRFTSPILDASSTSFTTAILLTMGILAGKKWPVKVRATGGASSTSYILLTDPDSTDLTPGFSTDGGANVSGTTPVYSGEELEILTNTSSQLRAVATFAAAVYVRLVGWTDDCLP